MQWVKAMAFWLRGGDHAMVIDAGSSASRLTAFFHSRALKKQGPGVHGKAEYTLFKNRTDVLQPQPPAGCANTTPDSKTESNSSVEDFLIGNNMFCKGASGSRVVSMCK